MPKSPADQEDKILLWLDEIDNWVMVIAIGVATLAVAMAFGVLLKPVVLGTPF